MSDTSSNNRADNRATDEATKRSALEVLRQSRVLSYGLGTFILIAGIVLLFWPGRTVLVVARLSGLLLMIVGAGDLFDTLRNHRKGSYWGLLALRDLVNLGFGIALVFWTGISLSTLVWLVGLDLVISGVLGLIVRSQMPSEIRSTITTRSIITVLAGIAVMVWPSTVVNVMAIVVGSIFSIIGVSLLWTGRQLSRLRSAVEQQI